MSAALASFLEETRLWTESELERFVPEARTTPPKLFEALRYALFGGGKRLRPAVCRMVCAELGGEPNAAARPAVALELIHTYSLVHDDLPCMDDDALRRGRPTVHVAYDEATAVLVGDALQALAFEVLAGAETAAAELVAALARAAGGEGMVGGQVLDLALSSEASLFALRDMHRRKTAALFGAAAEMGALVAGVTGTKLAMAREYGLALGQCFQATDDLLDVTGDAATLGKTPGKDAALERNTLVTSLGLEAARGEAEALGARACEAADLLGWGTGSLPVDLVHFVLQRTA